MIVTDASIRSGAARVPWWYGISHRDVAMRAAIWLPVPLNFVVRACLDLTEWWDIFRATPGKHQLALERAVYEAGVRSRQAGYVEGWKQALRHGQAGLRWLGTLSDDEFAQRARDFGYEPPDEVKYLIPFWKERAAE